MPCSPIAPKDNSVELTLCPRSDWAKGGVFLVLFFAAEKKYERMGKVLILGFVMLIKRIAPWAAAQRNIFTFHRYFFSLQKKVRADGQIVPLVCQT